MQRPEIPLVAQAARPTDYPLVARLCRRAVGSGDYVLRVLRETIRDGTIFLAWSNSRLVGMVNFETCIDGSGWLGMGRTDPDWRRRGVALFLQRQIETEARRRGIGYLRLWVLSSNKPSLQAALKGGFRPVCEGVHVTGIMRAKRRTEGTRPLTLGSLAVLKSFLRSPYLSKMNGYFAYKWHFVRASGDLLKKLVSKGELYSDEDDGFILTRPEVAFGHKYSNFTPLKGTAGSNLRKIKILASGDGPISVGSYLPYDGYLLSVARKQGFRRDSWGNHCIVFEKRIR